MARYELRIKKSAAKEIEGVQPKAVRRKIIQRIQALAEDPRPRGCEKLTGNSDRYRIRQGAWRIVYEVIDQEVSVCVIKVGHRRDIYRHQ